ncbi:MAG TPA: ABC transporter permease [Candidatus Acidoferrales bacterium]|nr:ABC transporter permease [Candidatus Acidoferrales bacterium]
METLLKDLRFAIRTLAKKPAFTAVAVLSLALGIGANTTIFTLVNAVLLHPIPVKDPSRVVSVYTTDQRNKGPFSQFMQSSVLNAKDYREKNDVFESSALIVDTGANLDVSGTPALVNSELVSGNYFDVLGVHFSLGRGFLPDEDLKPGASAVAVLSYQLWQQRFGGEANVINRTILLDRQPFTVVGVAPKGFRGVNALGGPDLWVPMMMHGALLTGVQVEWFDQRRPLMADMVARLKPEVSVAQAESSIDALAGYLREEYPTDNAERGVTLLPLSEALVNPNLRTYFVQAGLLLMVVVGLVLLIACANVANLLLSRATQRQREIAIRLSLGASRERLVRQLLTESLLLAAVAGVVGILFAFWSRNLLWSLRPSFLTEGSIDLSLDSRVLIFTFALAIFATVLFGLIPAWRASKPTQIASLRDRTNVPSGSVHWYGVRGILVMTQVALSLIALVGAGLFVHSLQNAQDVDSGYETKHLMMLSFDLGSARYTQPQGEQFLRSVSERLSALPMVSAVSVTDSAPFAGGLQRTVFPEGVDTTDRRSGKLTPVIAVTPGYFAASGVSLERGRDFTEQDGPNSPLVAVVNQTMANAVWPGQDAIGKHMRFFGENWDVVVVGIAKNAKYLTLGEPSQPIVYFPLKQQYNPFLTLLVRTTANPSGAIANVRGTVQSLDPSLPLLNVQTMEQVMNDSLWAPRMGAGLLGAFGVLALLLAAMGTYGVMAYSVSQRTQEIGLRMALGAQRVDILRLILSGAMAMVLVGVGAGLLAALLAVRSLGTLLFDIGGFDAFSFFGTAALLVAVALVACWIPARRAMRVDPMVALRYE